MGKNSTEIVLSDLVRILWMLFKDRPFKKQGNHVLVANNIEDKPDNDNAQSIKINGHAKHSDKLSSDV